MRIDTGIGPPLAAVSKQGAAGSLAPSLRTVTNDEVTGAQRSEATPRPKAGEKQQQTTNRADTAARPRLPSGANWRIDQETRQVVAQITDLNDEVIKQVPPQELLDLAARFRRLRGLLFDERA